MTLPYGEYQAVIFDTNRVTTPRLASMLKCDQHDLRTDTGMTIIRFKTEQEGQAHQEIGRIPYDVYASPIFGGRFDDSLLTLMQAEDASTAIEIAQNLPGRNKEQIWACLLPSQPQIKSEALLSLVHSDSFTDASLRLSIRLGFIEFVQSYLKGMHKEELIVWGCIVFRTACAYGHQELAVWLLRQFPEHKESMIADYNFNAFRMACCNSHQETASWLLIQFGV